MQKNLSERVKVMHAPTKRTCAYSGDPINKTEIAITISPSKQSLNNKWLSLGSIRPLTTDLKNIDPSDEGNLGKWVSVEPDVFKNDVFGPRGKCIVCENSGPDSSSQEKIENGYSGIVSFTYKGYNDPWIHMTCIDDMIQILRNVFDLDATNQTEIAVRNL